MELQPFLDILAATPVLSDADKTKHRLRAENYSPWLRARMAAIIAEEEQLLLENHFARQAEARVRTKGKMEEVREAEEAERRKEHAEMTSLVSDITLC